MNVFYISFSFSFGWLSCSLLSEDDDDARDIISGPEIARVLNQGLGHSLHRHPAILLQESSNGSMGHHIPETIAGHHQELLVSKEIKGHNIRLRGDELAVSGISEGAGNCQSTANTLNSAPVLYGSPHHLDPLLLSGQSGLMRDAKGENLPGGSIQGGLGISGPGHPELLMADHGQHGGGANVISEGFPIKVLEEGFVRGQEGLAEGAAEISPEVLVSQQGNVEMLGNVFRGQGPSVAIVNRENRGLLVLLDCIRFFLGGESSIERKKQKERWSHLDPKELVYIGLNQVLVLHPRAGTLVFSHLVNKGDFGRDPGESLHIISHGEDQWGGHRLDNLVNQEAVAHLRGLAVNVRN